MGLQALLVQSRGADSMGQLGALPTPECRTKWFIPSDVRAERYLTDSPWDDEVIGDRTAEEYMGTRLGHPDRVWVLDERPEKDSPSDQLSSVGVACGRLGKVAKCQAEEFLATMSARWTGIGGQGAL